MPFTSAWLRRSSTVPLRHSSSTTSSFALLFHRFGKLDEPLGRVGPAVEQHVLDQFEQIFRHLLVNRQHAGVDDAHVEPGLDGVIQKRAVHRLAHGVVAAKAEADVADAAADLRQRQVFLDPLRRADEIHGVIRVLLHAGADGQHVRIKNDVLRREPDLLDQQIVGALADRDAPLKRIRLAALVKRHHDHRRAVAPDQLRLVQKLFLAFLERNGIDDALALQTFQAGLDDLPFRRVHHHRHLADVRLGRDEIEKPRHRGDAVNHSLVHADVDDLRAVLDLLAGDGQRGLVIAGLDELGELRRPGDVRALADVEKLMESRPDGSRVQLRSASRAQRWTRGRVARIVSASSPLKRSAVRPPALCAAADRAPRRRWP